LPCASAEPSRALIGRFAEALGRGVTIRGMPKPLLATLSLFVPILREVGEMLHQWDVPFEVDDSRFRVQFGFEATEPDEGSVLTVEWARRAYGAGS
jgi:hypothetical protein